MASAGPHRAWGKPGVPAALSPCLLDSQYSTALRVPPCCVPRRSPPGASVPAVPPSLPSGPCPRAPGGGSPRLLPVPSPVTRRLRRLLPRDEPRRRGRASGGGGGQRRVPDRPLGARPRPLAPHPDPPQHLPLALPGARPFPHPTGGTGSPAAPLLSGSPGSPAAPLLSGSPGSPAAPLLSGSPGSPERCREGKRRSEAAGVGGGRQRTR
ncbi:uncharacterized protein LOC116449494 [Corvus moneduloides]|uniref:uncharacterized protein LOC116449494 n=1 Tax=Corvus moneduloides TaxID=1196302 RepID=UPI0013647A2A|nr:uncharacterized protein LOC116449494 [Corvus moneduloides]